jgi:hypothetical protein
MRVPFPGIFTKAPRAHDSSGLPTDERSQELVREYYRQREWTTE